MRTYKLYLINYAIFLTIDLSFRMNFIVGLYKSTNTMMKKSTINESWLEIDRCNKVIFFNMLPFLSTSLFKGFGDNNC